MKRVVHILIVAAAVCLSVARPAAAGDTAKEKAKIHFDRAIKFFEKGEYADALIDFEASFQYRPHWLLKYNIAACHYYLKHDIEALKLLSEFLTEGGDEIKLEQKQQALIFMKELKGKVGTLALIGVEAPTTVAIDSEEPVTVTADGEIYVKKGKHEVKIAQGGKTIMNKTISFIPGEKVEVIAKVVTVKPPPPPPEEKKKEIVPPTVEKKEAGGAEETEKKPTAGGPAAMKRNAWITLGLGAGLLAGGIVAGGFTLSEKAKMDDAERDYKNGYDDPAVTESQLIAMKDRMDEHQGKAAKALIATLVLLPAGGALAAASVALFVISSKKGKESKPAASSGLVVTPWSVALVLPF
jgi:flagellar basal body-associated protein FliL